MKATLRFTYQELLLPSGQLHFSPVPFSSEARFETTDQQTLMQDAIALIQTIERKNRTRVIDCIVLIGETTISEFRWNDPPEPPRLSAERLTQLRAILDRFEEDSLSTGLQP